MLFHAKNTIKILDEKDVGWKIVARCYYCDISPVIMIYRYSEVSEVYSGHDQLEMGYNIFMLASVFEDEKQSVWFFFLAKTCLTEQGMVRKLITHATKINTSETNNCKHYRSDVWLDPHIEIGQRIQFLTCI